MHNLKELRKNLEIYKKKFNNRNIDFNIEEFKKIDKINRELISKKETLEQEKKQQRGADYLIKDTTPKRNCVPPIPTPPVENNTVNNDIKRSLNKVRNRGYIVPKKVQANPNKC